MALRALDGVARQKGRAASHRTSAALLWFCGAGSSVTTWPSDRCTPSAHFASTMPSLNCSL